MTTANYDFLERKLPNGYHDKLDDSLLDFYCLTRGTQNVLINDEGKIVRRKGYTLFGQAGSLSQGVKSSKTWKTSTLGEITFRSVYDALEVYYGGQYRAIHTGIKTNFKMRYDIWWDKTEGKDKLLFVNGEATIKSWTGGMTEIASWTSTTVTKKYAKQSSASNNFVFNSATKTLTQTNTDFVTLGFVVGGKVSVSGTTNNNAVFTIKTLTGSVMTFTDQDTIVTETISTNACVVGVLGRESWRAERFAQTGTKQVRIGANTYTYNAGETTPTLTLTADPTADCVAGLFVYQPVAVITPSGTDLPVGFPIDIMAVNINQVIFGSSLFRSVFVTKQSNFADVNYTALLRKAGEGGTMYLDSNLVGIATSKETTYITAGDSDVYSLVFEPFTDGTNAGEILRLKKLETAYGQGGVSHEAFVKAKNGIIYLSNEPTIDFLGNIEQVAGQRAKPISDPIKRFLKSIDRTDAVGLYAENYIVFLFPFASCLLIYDLERGFWQPPQVISAGTMCVYQGRIILHSNAKNESYTLFSSLKDDGKPIIAKIYSNIETLSTRTKKKIYDEVFFEAFVNNDTKTVYGQILSGYKGSANIHNFQFGFDDPSNFTETPASSSGIGGSPFGMMPFGTLIPNTADDAELGTLKLLRKIVQTNVVEAFTQQLYLMNDDEGSYFELVCWGTNSRLSTTTNIDIKE